MGVPGTAGTDGPRLDAATLTGMANAIRVLAMDAVEAAKSGHPGMPMGMADIAAVLFGEHLKFDPRHPDWPDRDRFVVSNGHGSMLLYALLHLTGYADMDIGQLRNFRQLHSRTPGHPEFGHAAGVETTTGPLGQGLANAVGMAIAERILAQRFGDGLVDHRTWVFAGDGCLMEGISHEAISLAGHLRLARLTVLFDDNGISIDGATGLSVGDDQIARFRACGWEAFAVDGHDHAAIREAIAQARKSDRPTMIACRTHIGFGAPTKVDTAGAHGSPLGAEEIAGTRRALGWTHPPFELPDDVAAAWRQAGQRSGAAREAWVKRHAADPGRADFDAWLAGDLPDGFGERIAAAKYTIDESGGGIATREASGRVLNHLAEWLPNLVGGSADLTGSNNTRAKGHRPITAADFSGGYMHWGVREHAMAAAMNGMALHGGIIPYGGTFLTFSDYCRPSIRLAALMGLRVVFVMTHDSIGLGEDGPTHQPVEHLASLRALPNLNVLRPADPVETAECWEIALAARNRPSVLSLTRQKVPTLRTDGTPANRSAEGAYELVPASGRARVTLVATGSEVGVAVDAAKALEAGGIAARVVSMPSRELFMARSPAEREAVLGAGTLKVGVEAAVGFGWSDLLGPDGIFVGMPGFGASAPAPQLYEHFGITAAAIVDRVRERLQSR